MMGLSDRFMILLLSSIWDTGPETDTEDSSDVVN